MEHYATYPGASMEFRRDPHLTTLLINLFRDHEITHVIETGTHLGLGSTTFLAEIISAVGKGGLVQLDTFEVNRDSYLQAKQNLAKFPFVKPHWGCTVSFEDAHRAIGLDDMLVNHHRYQGIYIDDTKTPVNSYLKEINASALYIDHPEFEGQNLLKVFINISHCLDNMLIVLDSAGGVGYLEFMTVVELMQDRTYWLLLDDVHHVKHFRSLQHVKMFKPWTLLGEQNGWALARHR